MPGRTTAARRIAVCGTFIFKRPQANSFAVDAGRCILQAKVSGLSPRDHKQPAMYLSAADYSLEGEMSFEKVPNFLVNLFEADMNSTDTRSYRFNSFLLDVLERQIFHDGMPVPLTPKAFDVLVYLIEHAGHLVEKDELMNACWPNSFVDEVNLPRTIHTLRRIFDKDGNGAHFIQTVPTKGYRFVAKVERINGNGAKELPGFELVNDHRALEFESFDALGAGSRSETDVPPPVEDRETSHRTGSRTVLVVSIALILTILVSGFWFSGGSWTTGTGSKGSRAKTDNGEAYQHYQQGRLLLERMHHGDVTDALLSFEKAIELDPNYAAAYAGKADAKIWTFWRSFLHDDISQARTAINTAIELDPSNSYAHTIFCRLKATYDWDFGGAERECRTAIDLDPADHEARREIAFLLSGLGREDEAMSEVEAAVSLAPTSFNKRSRGVVLYYSRRYDEAIEQLLQVEETDPNNRDTGRWLMNAYEMKGDYQSAFRSRIMQMEQGGDTPADIAEARAAFDKDGWPSVLRSFTYPESPWMAAAAAYAQLGEMDKAFESLEKLSDRRAIQMIHIAREPRMDPLRKDPRFDELLKRVGLK